MTPRNYWAIASFWCGLLGLLLALTAPIPLVPIISIFNWPLGLAALVTGWLGRRRAEAENDATASRRVWWGVRLGCAGWIIQFVTSAVKVLIIAWILATLFGSFLNQWQATPIP